eukprot:7831687-Pyramimonas_sp.AAC.1
MGERVGLTCLQRQALVRGQLVPTAQGEAPAAVPQHTGRPQCRHPGHLARDDARRGQDDKPRA